MTPEALTIISQFGPAGLLGLLWIMERRHASLRDRQLSETHQSLTTRQNEIGVIIDVVRDNTRAIVSLEQTQRQMLRLAERWNTRGEAAPASPPIATNVAANHAQPGSRAASSQRQRA